MAPPAKPITSPVSDAWYPTLALLMLSIGLVVTASFFINFFEEKSKSCQGAHHWRSGIGLPGLRVTVFATFSRCLCLIFDIVQPAYRVLQRKGLVSAFLAFL
ncbi:Transmembrane protein [Gossypium arboreum]|uniref:Dolichyl-diphosphooligosaccharide-protein glycosyltransferase subunit OST5 n=1 Tax=Gossypium arboreum TaxID=29729 RepID=A0A0B0PK66_GOSAR|nr:Transmembrane protein [Gossypium arboreum]